MDLAANLLPRRQAAALLPPTGLRILRQKATDFTSEGFRFLARRIHFPRQKAPNSAPEGSGFRARRIHFPRQKAPNSALEGTEDLALKSHFKGSVQRKLRWVETGVIRWVWASDRGAGQCFIVKVSLHLVSSLFPFPVSTTQFIGEF
jgi:hypothetical protein